MTGSHRGGAVHAVAIIARKEFGELNSTKSTVGAGFLSVVFFTFAVSGDLSVALDVSLAGLLVVRPLFVGLFLAYYGSSQVFLREKTDDVVETLLCSPATLRQLWLGKTMGVAVFASLFAFIAALVTMAIPIAETGEAVLPGGTGVLYLLLALPLTLACAVGARGYVQLLLGMRESHLISLLILILIVFGLGALGFAGLSAFGLAADRIGYMAAGAAVTLLLLTWAAERVSRERIVLSL